MCIVAKGRRSNAPQLHNDRKIVQRCSQISREPPYAIFKSGALYEAQPLSDYLDHYTAHIYHSGRLLNLKTPPANDHYPPTTGTLIHWLDFSHTIIYLFKCASLAVARTDVVGNWKSYLSEHVSLNRNPIRPSHNAQKVRAIPFNSISIWTTS